MCIPCGCLTRGGSRLTGQAAVDGGGSARTARSSVEGELLDPVEAAADEQELLPRKQMRLHPELPDPDHCVRLDVREDSIRAITLGWLPKARVS